MSERKRPTSKQSKKRAKVFKSKKVLKTFTPGAPAADDDDNIRLNKYISQSGVCSRREADQLISNGEVKVNGKIVTELGIKVALKDKVEYDGKRLNPEVLRYVLLNKPKDHITSTKDDKGRKTVMHIVRNACNERLYPVGQLDRNTTGVLLLTNDGELAKKLTHPSHGAEKLYHVVLDKSVTKTHLSELVAGIELEDGLASADEAVHVGRKRKEVGLRIQMGKNRIVRRMFAHLGYNVERLDRVIFAGLTKKELERGRWRHLSETEVGFLRRKR